MWTRNNRHNTRDDQWVAKYINAPASAYSHSQNRDALSLSPSIHWFDSHILFRILFLFSSLSVSAILPFVIARRLLSGVSRFVYYRRRLAVSAMPISLVCSRRLTEQQIHGRRAEIPRRRGLRVSRSCFRVTACLNSLTCLMRPCRSRTC